MITDFSTKLAAFALLVQTQQVEMRHKQNLACQANLDQCKTTIKNGKKFAKVDIGTSGRYMVEVETGNIFGIKGYGQVHKGHFYGTLETTSEYYWGEYYPRKIAGEPLPQGRGRSYSCPGLTFAPKPANIDAIADGTPGFE